MDLLLGIVEANAAARALSCAAAQSLHAVEDCSSVVEVCGKVLPAALSVLEGAAASAVCVRNQVVSCVQGLTVIMRQLQTAIEALNEHDGEGVLGVLLEHPAAWLDTYRGIRGMTAQLVALSCFLRAAAQRRQADGADEALDAAVKTFMAICARARDVANLLGSDLPEFAQSAAAAGWTPDRLQGAVLRPPAAAATAPEASGYLRCGYVCSATTNTSKNIKSNAGHATQTDLQQQQRQQPQQQQQPRSAVGVGWAARMLRFGKTISGGGGGSSGGAVAASAPAGRSHDTSPLLSGLGAAGWASLDAAACTLVARIQDTTLYDSEIDQLEQDRTYLQHRLEHLRAYRRDSASAGRGDDDSGDNNNNTDNKSSSNSSNQNVQAVAAGVSWACSGAAWTAAAAASQVQSEVLLAAVDARLQMVLNAESREGSSSSCYRSSMVDSSGCDRPQQQVQKGHQKSLHGASGGRAAADLARTAVAATCTCTGGVLRRSATARGRGEANVGGLADEEDLYDDDVRKRLAGMRWLPMCFVGA